MADRKAITADQLQALRDPRRSLRTCGKVPSQNAVDGKGLAPYDPTAITHRMQQDILSYIASPPIDPATGLTAWFLLVGSRQTGKSWTAEAGFYVKAAYAQTWKHLCTADTGDRAGELLKNINSLHKTWPSGLRAERQYDSEVWQATFKEVYMGGEQLVERVMRTQHAGQNPIGLPWDSIHWSEYAFCPEAYAYWSGLRPAIVNRPRSLMVWETTANPGTITPDVGFAREMYFAAKAKVGDDGVPSRFFARFYPFWDSKLCVRPWPKDATPELEEQRLFERYSPYGLRWEHLAFRRATFREDAEIRRDPDQFGIWYPFDDLTCWAKASGAIFQSHHLDRHRNSGRLVEWLPSGNAMFYRGWRKDPGEVDPDAAYLISVDPNGYGGRDHGAAELREVWQDEQIQVGVFAGGRSDGVDPEVLARWVGQTARRFRAWVIVESTGVGAGVISILRSQYPDIRLYHHNQDFEKPGVPASSKTKQEALAAHKDALMDDLVLQDKLGFGHHLSYQNDKAVEEGDMALQLQGGKTSRNRRGRGHWDRVSASMWGSWGVANGVCPRPMKPKPPVAPKAGYDTLAELDRVLVALDGARPRGAFVRQERD